MSSNPSQSMRKAIEVKSPKIAELIAKHNASDNVRAIGEYIDLLQEYAKTLEAIASVPKYKNDHYHTGQKVDAERYEFQPVHDYRTMMVEKHETMMPREACFYRLSERLRVNSAQIGLVDRLNKKALIQGNWVDLTEHELIRLEEFLNTDY